VMGAAFLLAAPDTEATIGVERLQSTILTAHLRPPLPACTDDPIPLTESRYYKKNINFCQYYQ
jgi:hypothetical protein